MTSPARLREPETVGAVVRLDPPTTTIKTTHGGNKMKLRVRNIRHEIGHGFDLRAEGEATVTVFERLAASGVRGVIAIILSTLLLDHLTDGLAVVKLDIRRLL